MKRRASAASAAEAALEQAFALTEEARRELDALLSRLEVDTGELERKEERLFAIRALARKYATTPDGLPAVLAEFRSRLELLDLGGGKLKEAEAAVGMPVSAYLEAAKRLSDARKPRPKNWKTRSPANWCR